MGYTGSGPTRTLALEIEAVKRAPDFMYEGAEVPFLLVRYAVVMQYLSQRIEHWLNPHVLHVLIHNCLEWSMYHHFMILCYL